MKAVAPAGRVPIGFRKLLKLSSAKDHSKRYAARNVASR